MKLNDWIREQRKMKDFTVTQLADKAGISHAQVSRIENNKSKISLVTLVRLLYALDVSYSSIFAQDEIDLPKLDILDNIRHMGKHNVLDFPCINFNDIELLDSKYTALSDKIKEITILLLQKFTQKFGTQSDEKYLKPLSELYYRCLGLPPFGLANMVPGLTSPEMPSSEDFMYPPGFSEKLQWIYSSGGALIFLDLGMYVHHVRLSQNLSLRGLGKMVGISHQGIKILETQTAEKLIFEDLVKLDQVLEVEGNLINFAWRATEIYTGAFRAKSISANKLQPFTSAEIFEIEKLIMASRLFQYFLPDDTSWLEWLREISVSGLPSDI
jgi:transcriptional regulator with XRE-family HTH domain